MKNGVLISSSNNYFTYPKEVIVCDTENEALLLYKELDSKFDKEINENESNWYCYATLINVKTNDN